MTPNQRKATALAIAREFDCEIISVDSALVYQGMDIGTAKPTAHELAAVPHHLIDIRDPREAYSAAEFAADAARLVREIRGRGALPLLVGGTMLYFKALTDGLDDMPAANPDVRALVLTGAGRGFCAGLDLSELDFTPGPGLLERADPARFEMHTVQNVGLEINIPKGIAYARVK
jgi:tRNA dimethylallyltransferase